MDNRWRGDFELEDSIGSICSAPAPLPPSPRRSTAFLDGVRGVAAFFVFIQHYVGSFDLNMHEHGFGESGTHYYFASLPFVRIIFNGGNSAVAIFFVLSGYVLSQSPLSLLREKRRDACKLSLLSATIRRPLRLYLPPFCISLATAFAMHLPWGIWPQTIWTPKETIFNELETWIVETIAFFQPFRTHGGLQAWYRYSLIMWTIPIELKGSILIFALLVLDILAYPPVAATFIRDAILVFVLLQFGYWTMACFIAGLLLSYMDIYGLDALLLKRFTARLQSLCFNIIFLIGYYLLCQPAHAGSPEYSRETPGWRWLSVLTPRFYGDEQYYRFWHSWGAILFVYATLRLGWLQRFFSTRPLRYLGHVSFMLYLVHLPLLYVIGDRIRRAVGTSIPGSEASWWDDRLWIPDIGPVGLNSRFLFSLAIMSAICLPIADIATRVIDKPSVRLGKKLTTRLGLEQKKNTPFVPR